MNLKDIKLNEIVHSRKQDYCIVPINEELGVVSYKNRKQNGDSKWWVEVSYSFISKKAPPLQDEELQPQGNTSCMMLGMLLIPLTKALEV